MSRFKDARDKGCAYLLQQVRADGSFGSPELGVMDYYKLPRAFLACGRSNAASRLLDWVRRNGMTPDGDFVPRPDPATDPFSYAYAYFNSWLITGAHRIGRYDIAELAIGFLLRFWNPDTGGFYSSYDQRDASTKDDLWVVSGSAQAALHTGRVDVARAAAGWMERLMDAQPNYPKQLFGVCSRASGLVTEPDPENEIRYLLNQDAEHDEFFFNPGIAGGFLACLYRFTGETKWLDLAKEYMRLAEGASGFHFKSLRAGKVGWAASLLYSVTGEEKYREMAVRVGDNIIEAQSEDGYWAFPTPQDINNDASAEMVIWLDEIHQAVGSD